MIVKYRIQNCSSPKCTERLTIRTDELEQTHYCEKCKKKYPLAVLRLQTDYELPLKELLLDVAKTYHYHSAEWIAGVLGISRKLFMAYIEEFFNMKSWEEFKKEYQCKSSTCYLVEVNNLFASRFTNKYYIVKKLKKDLDVCACLLRQNEEGVAGNKILVNVPSVSHLHEFHKESVLFKLEGITSVVSG